MGQPELTTAQQRNVIFHDAFDAYFEVHDDLDRIDLNMSGEMGAVHAEIREMLDGTRAMSPAEERALGELARAWRQLSREATPVKGS